jgi:hypothetical protein
MECLINSLRVYYHELMANNYVISLYYQNIIVWQHFNLVILTEKAFGTFRWWWSIGLGSPIYPHKYLLL